MTTTESTYDDSYATTFEAVACSDCDRRGLTADQCARILHAEQMTKIALAEELIAKASTPAETVLPAQIKAAAKAADRRLSQLKDREDAVAVVDRGGFPRSITTRADRKFQAAIRAGMLAETDEQSVYQLS